MGIELHNLVIIEANKMDIFVSETQTVILYRSSCNWKIKPFQSMDISIMIDIDICSFSRPSMLIQNLHKEIHIFRT